MPVQIIYESDSVCQCKLSGKYGQLQIDIPYEMFTDYMIGIQEYLEDNDVDVTVAEIANKSMIRSIFDNTVIVDMIEKFNYMNFESEKAAQTMFKLELDAITDIANEKQRIFFQNVANYNTDIRQISVSIDNEQKAIELLKSAGLIN